VEKHSPLEKEEVISFLAIGDVLIDVNIDMRIEVKITIERPPENLAEEFEKLLYEFEKKLAEIEARLEGATIELEIHPGVFKTLQDTRGLSAVRRLVEIAKALEDDSYMERPTRPRKALRLIHAAKINLEQAEKILERAAEWEEEHREIWDKYWQRFEEAKEYLMKELGKDWEEILREHKGRLEELKQKMRERLLSGPMAPGALG